MCNVPLTAGVTGANKATTNWSNGAMSRVTDVVGLPGCTATHDTGRRLFVAYDIGLRVHPIYVYMYIYIYVYIYEFIYIYIYICVLLNI